MAADCKYKGLVAWERINIDTDCWNKELRVLKRIDIDADCK